MDLEAISSPKICYYWEPVAAEERDLTEPGGDDDVSERGGGLCVSWRRGQPDKQSPVLTCMHVSRDCLS